MAFLDPKNKVFSSPWNKPIIIAIDKTIVINNYPQRSKASRNHYN
jgi:hypothetical protein